MTDFRIGVGQRDFLFVQSTTEIGGAETVLLNLFESSEELRRRSLVVTLGFGSGDLPLRLRRVGAQVEEFRLSRMRYPWRVVPTLLSLARRARQLGVRAVVGNGAHPQLIAGPLARLCAARSVYVVHGIYPFPLRANEPGVVAAFLAPCDLILAVSQAAEQAAARLRPSKAHRLLYNGTPLREVSTAEARAARVELGVRDDEILIGAFGRLQRSKGQDVFVDAAGEIGRIRKHVRFVVVGGSVFGFEPEYFDELRQQAADLGLSDRLTFTGFRTDVLRLMAACDIVCNPSRAPESFGMTIVEAMGVGRPVVASSGGGPSEIISSAEVGLLVPPDDAGALAGALLGLVDDPDGRRRIGAAGQVRVQSHFSIEVMASTLIGYLDDVMASR